jgi:hypothetical protein
MRGFLLEVHELNIEDKHRVGGNNIAEAARACARRHVSERASIAGTRDLPYALSAGIVSVRFSPTHMPCRPSSQPLITWPAPTTHSLMSFERDVTWKGGAYVSTEAAFHGRSYQKRLA